MNLPPRKILILKTGITETFSTDSQESSIVSLGDILRTTPILKILKSNDLVYWVTSKQGLPLLSHIPAINYLLSFEEYLNQYKDIEFDIFFNLERYIPKDAFPKAILQYGFIPGNSDQLRTVTGTIALDEYKQQYRRKNMFYWQHMLFGLIGRDYRGETYSFADKTTNSPEDERPIIGLNWKVGSKWPTKEIEKSHWYILSDDLEKSGFVVSWQEGHDHLETYIDWIARCDFIITCDSLGLHLAIAMNKKFIAFFGPTPSNEIDFYKNGTFVPFATPKNYDCLPCHQRTCHQAIICTKYIDYPKVLAVVINEFKHEE